MIEFKDVSKYYGSSCAVSNINFVIPAGKVIGIIGPNGSGKTTLVGLITKVLKVSSGEILINVGQEEISVASEDFGLPEYYTVKRALKLFSIVKHSNREQVENLTLKLGLTEHLNKKTKQLSLGLRQRLKLECALMGNPKIVILDEPNNGLDPSGFILLRKLILELKEEGKTVILASHLLHEVEKSCDSIIMLKNGKVVNYKTIEDLKAKHSTLEDAYEAMAS